MIKKLLCAGAVAVLATVGLASGASADASGTCTLSGKTVKLKVEEVSNGVPSKMRIDSPYELDLGTTVGSSSSWGAYNQAGAFVSGGYFVAAPIDGDGLYNYAKSVLYDGTPLIGSVQFAAQRKGSTASCGGRVYIS